MIARAVEGERKRYLTCLSLHQMPVTGEVGAIWGSHNCAAVKLLNVSQQFLNRQTAD